jgi:heat shock protein HspQ
MLDTNQLPFLIRLLDEEDPEALAHVLDALAAFGPDLEAALADLEAPPDPATVGRLKALLAAHVEALAGDAAGSGIRFEPGQVVRHRRYGYRGVVVDADPTCEADDAWYRANRTHPDKDQPWYHVLVHNSMQVTYAAQSSLDEDDSGDEVVHPYVDHFFTGFHDGRYLRNDQPWPG